MMERTCRWAEGPETFEAACGWGSWMVPADSMDNTRYGFCGGCGGRIELVAFTESDHELAESADTAAASEGGVDEGPPMADYRQDSMRADDSAMHAGQCWAVPQ